MRCKAGCDSVEPRVTSFVQVCELHPCGKCSFKLHTTSILGLLGYIVMWTRRCGQQKLFINHPPHPLQSLTIVFVLAKYKFNVIIFVSEFKVTLNCLLCCNTSFLSVFPWCKNLEWIKEISITLYCSFKFEQVYLEQSVRETCTIKLQQCVVAALKK